MSRDPFPMIRETRATLRRAARDASAGQRSPMREAAGIRRPRPSPAKKASRLLRTASYPRRTQ